MSAAGSLDFEDTITIMIKETDNLYEFNHWTFFRNYEKGNNH